MQRKLWGEKEGQTQNFLEKKKKQNKPKFKS